jgi:hypothetical protein
MGPPELTVALLPAPKNPMSDWRPRRNRRKRSEVRSSWRWRVRTDQFVVFQFSPKVGRNRVAEGSHIPFDLGAKNCALDDQGDE